MILVKGQHKPPYDLWLRVQAWWWNRHFIGRESESEIGTLLASEMYFVKFQERNWNFFKTNFSAFQWKLNSLRTTPPSFPFLIERSFNDQVKSFNLFINYYVWPEFFGYLWTSWFTWSLEVAWSKNNRNTPFLTFD